MNFTIHGFSLTKFFTVLLVFFTLPVFAYADICDNCGGSAYDEIGRYCELGYCDDCCVEEHSCPCDDCEECSESCGCSEEICQECERCTECIGSGDLCPDCLRCVECIGSDLLACGACAECCEHTCECAACDELCTEECGCSDAFCPGCGYCSECYDPGVTFECAAGYCSDCCANAHVCECVDCETCSETCDCSDEICSICSRCSECLGADLQACGACEECCEHTCECAACDECSEGCSCSNELCPACNLCINCCEGNHDEQTGGPADTAEPIDTTTGNNYFTEDRLHIPCPGIPLEVNLKYQSVTTQPEGLLGTNWRHSYEWHLAVETNQAVLYSGSGNKYVFRKENGSFFSPASNNWTLEEAPNGYRVGLPGGLRYEFDAGGRLLHIFNGWGRGVTCSYNTNNCLERVEHDNGRAIEFSNVWHDGIGQWRIDSIHVPDGARLDFAYNVDGLFTQIVETVGTMVSTSHYIYTEGYLSEKINGAGHIYSFNYEAGTNGLLNGKGDYLAVDGFFEHSVEYVNSHTTDVTYTSRGSDQIYRYARDSQDVLQTIYGPSANEADLPLRGTHYEMDGHDVLEQTEFDSDSGAFFSTFMQYDEAHNLTNIAVAYNTANPVVQASMKYDPVWQLPSLVKDTDDGRTEMVYTNGLPLVIRRFRSDTESYDTHLSYTTNGQLSAITNVNNRVTRFTYNAQGDLETITAPAGPIISNGYNALGFVTCTEILSEDGISNGRITEYLPDNKGRITQITYPDGLTSSFEYNALDYLTNFTDRAGRLTEYEYAPTRKLTSVTRYLNKDGSNVPVRLSYNYDEQFNTLAITEPRGRYVESYQLDVQDRVRAVTNIEGQVMTLNYSVGSFITNISRFDGSQIEIRYNNAGLKDTVAYHSPDLSPLDSCHYIYYMDGQLKTASDSTTSISNIYDRLNQLTHVIFTNEVFSSQNTHWYDPQGWPLLTYTQIRHPERPSRTIQLTTSRDNIGRLKQVKSKILGLGEQRFYYGYSPENGRVSSVSNLASGFVATYAYDIMDRATNISYHTSDGTLMRSLDYKYDAVGMIREKTDFDASITSTVSTVYTYDSLDRLVHESVSANSAPLRGTTYSYDLAGNRLSKVSNGWKTEYTLGTGNRLATTTASPLTNSLFISGQANEPIGTDNCWGQLYITNLTLGASVIPSVNGSTFSAEIPCFGNATNTIVCAIGDCAGNVGYATNHVFVPVAQGSATSAAFEYDAAGCLTNLNGMTLGWDERYRLTRVDETSSLVSHTYDILDRRVSRTEGSNVVYYIHNGRQVVADLNGNGDILRTYTWGEGIDNLLCFTDHTTTNTYYAIKDHQNSVLALVDENGTVLESYEYDAWGNTKVFDASGAEIGNQQSAIGNRYLWQGREYDTSTGLYYFRARWYDPATGRWLSKDPIGISGGLNQYVFCSNNPCNAVDPFGLDTFELNSELGGSGRPVPIDQLTSHTLQYTTDENGNLEHTYSWAPDGGAMVWDGNKADWQIDNPRDRSAARLDLLFGQGFSMPVGFDSSYDDLLDAEIRRRIASGEDVHYWYLWDNCKTQLNEVDKCLE